MSQPPKKQPKRSVETHIYMTPALKRQLEQAAERGCRSVNGQILHYVQRGIEQDARP
jgi:hypothetical protein